MSLAAGTRLGPYEILASIGAGGMGEVFRARDPRLGRDVALKVLPEIFARDEGRRARFSQEARAAGALNHPGIVAVYDIGFSDGAFYMVTELVEGLTVRALLDEGRPSQRKTIDISVQVAEALAAAHAAAITHRDLKPENIMVTQEGRAKILDFGLAKHTAASSTTSAEGATATVAITQEGAVLGTMGYMAPEQIRGKPADARTDIFCLGLVMYEMLSGLRAFQRDTSADSISALLREDPGDLPASVPPGLAQIVQRCLEKEPARRFQSSADLAFALRALQGSSATATTQHDAMRSALRNWLPWAIAVTGVAIGAAGWLILPDTAQPAYDVIPLTTFSGIEYQPALSPDSKQLAFVWAGEPAGARGVYVKLVDGGAPPLRISPPGKASAAPCWSPDGTRIAYIRNEANERLTLIAPALGGPERRIAHFGGGSGSIDWSPNGKWIAATIRPPSGTPSIHLISVESGESHLVAAAPKNASDMNPRFSPDGKEIAFVRSTNPFSNSILRVGLRPDGTGSGEPQQVGNRTWFASLIAWSADSRSLIVPAMIASNIQYWRIAAHGNRAERLPLQFPNDIGGRGVVSVRGNRMATTIAASQMGIGRIVWNEASRGWQSATFYESSRADDEPQPSPNGEWVAFCSTRSGNREIWRARPDGSEAMQLTVSGASRVGSPRWSSDSQWIAFDSARESTSDIFLISAEGGKTRQMTSRFTSVRPSFSMDGKWLYCKNGVG